MDNKIALYMCALRRHKRLLTKQQYKTIKGQILSGDGEGAMRGIGTIIQRNERKRRCVSTTG